MQGLFAAGLVALFVFLVGLFADRLFSDSRDGTGKASSGRRR